MKASVAIVDNNPVLQKGITSVLQQEFGAITVFMEVSEGETLLKALEETTLMPHVCILDLYNTVDGFETLKALKTRYRSIKVLVYSAYSRDFSISYALALGGSGYLSKDSSPDKLKEALQAIITKGVYQSEEMIKSYHYLYLYAGHPEKMLQERELEYIRLCCQELSNEEIAARKHLSPRTIGGYRDRIYDKLKIHSKAALVKFALETGLYSSP